MSPETGLRARLCSWRDRLLTSPDFQQKAFRNPLMRWVARRRMRALFDLCSGFVYSQVLLACTRLDLFRLLSSAPRTAEQLAVTLSLPLASVERLMEAAHSLDLVETRSGRAFGLGPLGAALLGNPSVALMIEHHSDFYSDLNDPIALMRGQSETALSQFWGYSGNEDPAQLGSEQTAEYSRLMAASQAMIADQVLQAYPVSRHRRLLDVGGGAGAFALAALRRHEALEARVFDLPSVASLAMENFQVAGVADRGGATGGSFLSDALPEQHDLISLVRILHDHNDDTVLRLLATIRQAIPVDGTLLIAEPMLGTHGAEPVSAAYFGFYLMAMGQGRARRATTIKEMLEASGFTTVREHRTTAPLLVRVLSARPAA